MRRKTPLTPKTPIKRKAAPKKKPDPVKREATFERAYGGAERVEWMKAHPCLACGAVPSENAHVRNGGMGRKADAKYIVPLCHTHHEELHRRGQDSFEVRYGLCLDIYAEILSCRWDDEQRNRTKEKIVAVVTGGMTAPSEEDCDDED